MPSTQACCQEKASPLHRTSWNIYKTQFNTDPGSQPKCKRVVSFYNLNFNEIQQTKKEENSNNFKSPKALFSKPFSIPRDAFHSAIHFFLFPKNSQDAFKICWPKIASLDGFQFYQFIKVSRTSGKSHSLKIGLRNEDREYQIIRQIMYANSGQNHNGTRKDFAACLSSPTFLWRPRQYMQWLAPAQPLTLLHLYLRVWQRGSCLLLCCSSAFHCERHCIDYLNWDELYDRMNCIHWFF